MIQDKNQTPASFPVLVEVTRGGMVESRHRGFIAVVDAAGKSIASLGDIETRTWFRSAAKPFQTIPVITSGAAEHFKFTDQELAVITGSHSGEEVHIELVKSILFKINLDETALLCGSHMPFDEETATRMRAAVQKPTAIHNNCSGKHAGMLAIARYKNEPIENYLDPNHAVQRRIRHVLARFACVPDDDVEIAVDGCSAPVFGLSIKAMARSYAQLVGGKHTEMEPDLQSAAERVATTMTDFPEMIGGTSKRLDTDLMRAAPGAIISKVGAEGVHLLGVKPCARYPMGLGIAIKIEDGDIRRARDRVVIEILRQLELLDETQLAWLSAYVQATIFNYRNVEVGEIRTCFNLWDRQNRSSIELTVEVD